MRGLTPSRPFASAPRTEGASLLVDAVLASELRNKADWNVLAKLGENTNFKFGWFDLIHQADPKWDRPAATP